MSKIITQCPSCSSVKLEVAKINCLECHTKFEGTFEIPDVLKLSTEELQFIFDFVKCSGSLKEMANKQQVSYPTLRNRLSGLIKAIENIEIKKEGTKLKVLQLLEEGKISASDAASMLNKV